jgi:hypothetical protein
LLVVEIPKSALRRYEDVLRIEVPVIDAALVAVLERINDSKVDAFDEFILARERGRLDDRVKIASAEIIDTELTEGVMALVDLVMEGEHVGKGRDASVE